MATVPFTTFLERTKVQSVSSATSEMAVKVGIVCPERWWIPCSWRHSRSGWTWVTWSICRALCSFQGSWTRPLLRLPFNSNDSAIYDSMSKSCVRAPPGQLQYALWHWVPREYVKKYGVKIRADWGRNEGCRSHRKTELLRWCELCSIQVWALQHMEDVVQRRTMMMMRGLESLSYEESWESWVCSASKKEGSEEILLQP